MKTKTLFYCAIVTAVSALCPYAFADTLIIGANDGVGNIAPFGSLYKGEYQQVYSAASFTGPVLITGISFFPASAGQVITGSFTLDFSTTNASTSTGAGGLSTTSANNLGANNTLFSSGNVSGVTSFTGSPFLYNPAMGNLLLDVNNISASSFGALAAGCSTATNRIFNAGGMQTPTSGLGTAGCASGYGLETQLTFTPVANSVTPEPSSFILLGTGILSLATAAVRRFPRG